MFNEKMPIRFIAGFQLFVGIGIGILWVAKIAPSILKSVVPIGLEYYTTLVIHGMDLAFIVPTAILSAVLLIKRKPMGYLLTSVIVIKGFTMLTALSAIICFVLMMKSVKLFEIVD